MIERIQSQGDLSPEAFVDSCLDLIGPLQVRSETRQQLVNHATEEGVLSWSTAQEVETSSTRVGEMFQLIASLREFQYC
jgi:DNA invertase Pin-like site-specific DNA recombinase